MKNGLRRSLITATAVLGLATAGSIAWYCAQGGEAVLTLAISVGTTFYHFAMRLAAGGAARWLVPAGAENSPWFCPKPWEPGLYRFLRVKRWKKYMPTYNPDSFDIRKHTPEEMIHTMCVSEAGHEMIMLLSFLPVLTIPTFGQAGVFWTTSVLSALLDGSFVILQRYNRPRMVRILEKERKRP